MAHITHTYPYNDENGAELFQVVRYSPKGFSQRRRDPLHPGKWLKKLDGVRRVPYRLQALNASRLEGRPIYIVEGEKDADTLFRTGLCATTFAGGAGAGNLIPGYVEFFRGAAVVIIPDKDEVGRAYAKKIADALIGVAADIRVLEMPDGCKDASDWFMKAGGTRQQLETWATSASPVQSCANGNALPPATTTRGNGSGSGEPIPEGQRNHHLTSLAGAMRRRGMNQEAIVAALLVVNQDRCDPQLPEKDVRAIAWSVSRYDPHPVLGQSSALVLNRQDSMPSARAFLEQRYTVQGTRTLIFFGGQLLGWHDGAYKALDEGELQAAAFNFFEGACHLNGDPFQPNKNRVAEMLAALKAQTILGADQVPPRWLSGDEPFPAHEILAVRNGLLHLPTGRLVPHDPRFFVRNVLPVAFDPKAKAMPHMTTFMRSLFERDEERPELMREIFGHFLTPDTRHQKIFMIVGPKRAGKGVIGRLLTALLGRDNVCGPTLGSIEQPFGLSGLLGKQLAVVSDARLSTRADQKIVAERLLTLSGEDGIDINRKFREALPSVRLAVRFLLLTNELPRIADASGALASRFIIIPLTRSFYDKEDHRLEIKLNAELSAILNWAIEGWKRLEARGHFLIPESSRVMQEQFEDLGSPIAAFIRDRCETGNGFTVPKRVLFDAWREWSQKEGRGEYVGDLGSFGRNLRAAFPELGSSRPRTSEGGQVAVCVGLRVRPAVRFEGR